MCRMSRWPTRMVQRSVANAPPRLVFSKQPENEDHVICYVRSVAGNCPFGLKPYSRPCPYQELVAEVAKLSCVLGHVWRQQLDAVYRTTKIGCFHTENIEFRIVGYTEHTTNNMFGFHPLFSLCTLPFCTSYVTIHALI